MILNVDVPREFFTVFRIRIILYYDYTRNARDNVMRLLG